jgi:hypothetical protein
MIQHFIPSESVNLSMLFTEWNALQHKRDELAALFSGRVALAARSKRTDQAHTEVSQVLLPSSTASTKGSMTSPRIASPLDLSGKNEPTRHHSPSQDFGANHGQASSRH